jgi:hypothetical protein
LAKSLDKGFPQKGFCGVFEHPLLRNAQNMPFKKKIVTNTYSIYHLVAICQINAVFDLKLILSSFFVALALRPT